MSAAFTTVAARSIFLLAMVALLLAALYARGNEPGITFGTFTSGNGFNLTIDSHAIYNGVLVPGSTWTLKNLVPGADKFFNIADVKPGDTGEATISLHVNKNAWICLDFKNLKNKENGINEPESLVDHMPAVGELAQNLKFFAWFDNGDNIFQVGEQPIFGTSTQAASIVLASTTYPLADSKHGTSFVASTTRYIGIKWCAGTMAINLATAAISCNGATLGNEVQTDSMSVDISFRATPSADKPSFLCKGKSKDPDEDDHHDHGEEIGHFVKCETIAKIGWPLPRYETECPNSS